ncbi:type I methionyl aminopeptidase [Ureaplasma ceti]|uniref:Methionine aminopeptidase n=1 Tax=Ureaplasma ceti TaxID=3119530 RepID=A0ABP9U531_9BACT
MKVIIKTKDDISKIKEAVRIWKIVRQEIRQQIHAGMTTLDLDNLAKEVIESNGGIPTFLGMYGFPNNICISVNDCVIHGVPNDIPLKDGDMVTFDMGVTYEGHVCDAAFTVIIGENPEAEKISAVCRGALINVKDYLKPGVSNLQIAQIMQEYIESRGYEVLRDFTGHGCGNSLHEDPAFPNYVDYRFPIYKLREGMVICLEPMILTDSRQYEIDQENEWSVYAKNHKLTCHWEDMFLITRDGCELLTSED